MTAFHKPVGTALAAGRFQNSDCRGQRSEAVQAYTVETVCLQSLSAAKTIKILLNPVGAGVFGIQNTEVRCQKRGRKIL